MAKGITWTTELRRLGDLREWEEIVDVLKNPKHTVRVAVVGKYTSNGDAYKSISESLTHAGIPNDARVEIHWIESDQLELGRPPAEVLENVDALVVSLPAHNLTGTHALVEQHRRLVDENLPPSREIVDLQIGDEMLFILKKRGG